MNGDTKPKQSDTKQNSVGLLVLSGCLAFILILFVAYFVEFPGGSSAFAIFTIVGTILLIGLVAIIALTYAMAGISDKQSPLALPEGSIRGILALGLLAVFIGTSAFLYTGLSSPGTGPVLQTNFFDTQPEADDFIKKNPSTDFLYLPPSKTDEEIKAEATAGDGKASPTDIKTLHDAAQGKRWKVETYLRANTQAAQDMAKLVFVTVSTALATITGFYFGSGTASTATKLATAAEASRTAGGNPPPLDAGAVIQKQLAAAKEDAAAIAKAAADAKIADQQAGPAGAPTNDAKYTAALKELPTLDDKAKAILAQITQLAAGAEQDAAAGHADTSPAKRQDNAAKAQQTLVTVQQQAEALRALRTTADADLLYVRTVLPPPSAASVDAIVKRQTDAQAKLDGLGKTPLKTLKDTVAEYGPEVSAAATAALASATTAWDKMDKALASLAGDAARAQNSTSNDAQALATTDAQSQGAAQDFDTAYQAFVAARTTIQDQASQG